MKHKRLFTSMLIIGGLLISAEAYCLTASCLTILSACASRVGCAIPVYAKVTYTGTGTAPSSATVQVKSYGACPLSASSKSIPLGSWQKANGYFYAPNITGYTSSFDMVVSGNNVSTVTCGSYPKPAGGPYLAVCVPVTLSSSGYTCGTPIFSTTAGCP